MKTDDISTMPNDTLSLIRHKLAVAIRDAERAASDLAGLESVYSIVCAELASRKVFA